MSKKCKFTLVENNCFDLNTPKKLYRFKGTKNDGNDWADKITETINDYASN